jgi:hypothetical protein
MKLAELLPLSKEQRQTLIRNYQILRQEVDKIGKEYERLFVTLYAKSTDKMPRQHTSNPKIPKVSKAIASPFY